MLHFSRPDRRARLSRLRALPMGGPGGSPLAHHARAGEPRDETVAGVPPGASEALARDRALLRRWRAGDREAGNELLTHYQGLFYRTCRRLGARDEDQIHEVWQELVLALLERLSELAERVSASFAGFLVWQTRAALDRVRGRHRPAVPIEDLPDARATDGFEALDAIQKCADKLPPVERRIFELRYQGGLSLQEAARALGSNANAVGQGVFRLARKMRECLQRAGFGDQP